MSPASSSSGVLSSARRIEIPDGPPAPVISTRSADTGHLRGQLERAVARRGDLHRVAVAHDLEGLDVPRLREARPVAGGRPQQLVIEVAADLDLRLVGLDDLELGVQELVDGDE